MSFNLNIAVILYRSLTCERNFVIAFLLHCMDIKRSIQ